MTRRVVLVAGLLLAGCTADSTFKALGCPAGTHDEAGICKPDETCMPSTCNSHGTCAIAESVPICQCESGYLGDNCAQCAPGYELDPATNACEAPICGGISCGSFGTCVDAGGTPTCECKYGMTGAACDQCPTPANNLVWDTFGPAGNHHTLGMNPGDIVVGQLPALPTTSNGPQIVGTLTYAEVPYAPDGNYTLAFSRCPGDMTAYSSTQEQTPGINPCRAELGRTGLLYWRETGAPNNYHCYLPPSDGPWYANVTVKPSDLQACQDAAGRQCVINWQWN